MFPDIKGIGIFVLRSSLSAEIKGLISRNLRFCERDGGREPNTGAVHGLT